jgi:hypothetical protein
VGRNRREALGLYAIFTGKSSLGHPPGRKSAGRIDAIVKRVDLLEKLNNAEKLITFLV